MEITTRIAFVIAVFLTNIAWMLWASAHLKTHHKEDSDKE